MASGVGDFLFHVQGTGYTVLSAFQDSLSCELMAFLSAYIVLP